MLDHAIAWARRGFRVFPVIPASKKPAVSSFPTEATTDEEKIRRWWTDPVAGVIQPYNVGVCTTGMVVLDIDRKSNVDGQPLYEELGGHYDTLVVRTPSGGLHAYYNGPDSSLAPAGPGLDVRSHNGYVLAPGSVVENGSYTIENDRPLALLPDPIRQRLRAPGIRAGDGAGDQDETAIAAAQERLLSVAPAIEGQGGDNTTFRVCAMLVRDYGLDADSAMEAIDDWNESCVPPWPKQELRTKIENAIRYGKAEVGLERPNVQFRDVKVVAPPAVADPEDMVDYGNAVDVTDIPERPWIIPGLLMRRHVTMLAAPGSTGKSVLCMTVAAFLANGTDLGGRYKHRGKACRVLYYSAEEDLHEQSRRLAAICTAHGLDYRKTAENLRLWTLDDVNLMLAQTGPAGVPAHNTTHSDLLGRHTDGADVVILDPLADIHLLPESDNAAMSWFMRHMRGYAMSRNIAVLVTHHVAKGIGNREGNVDIMRGASAIANSARTSLTLFPPTEEDCSTYGIPKEERNRYVRLDDAKMNLGLASLSSTWLKKEPVKLANGDVVGVLKFHEMTEAAPQQAVEAAHRLASELFGSGKGSMKCAEAAACLQSLGDQWVLTPSGIRQKLERLLRDGVETPVGNVRFVRDPNPVIVLE